MQRLWFLCLALGLVGASQAQTKPDMLVVSGGTLVDVASGIETPDSAIVISGQRIERVGTVADDQPGRHRRYLGQWKFFLWHGFQACAERRRLPTYCALQLLRP